MVSGESGYQFCQAGRIARRNAMGDNQDPSVRTVFPEELHREGDEIVSVASDEDILYAGRVLELPLVVSPAISRLLRATRLAAQKAKNLSNPRAEVLV